MTWKRSQLALAGAAALLLAGPFVTRSIAAQQDEAKKEPAVGKRVIIVDRDDDGHTDGNRVFVVRGDGDDRLPFAHMLADQDMNCVEQNGKKICTARVGPMHFPGFSGTFLGVELTDMTAELREHLGGPRDAGVLVSRVEEGSPAAEAGLQVGDIVTAVEGDAIESPHDLRQAIASRDAGATVKIDLYRDGRPEQISAVLGKREPHDVFKYFGPGMIDPKALHDQIHQALEGIDLQDLDATVRKQLDAVDWNKIKDTIRQALDQALAPQTRDEKK